MSTLRDELHRLVESLPEEELSQVLDFVKVHLSEPEDLTEDELRELEKGKMTSNGANGFGGKT